MSNLNILTILGKVGAIGGLIGAIQVGQSSLATLQKDADIQAELARCPHINLRLKLVSAELRTVQNGATAIKKSNFFTIFGHVQAFVRDCGKLEHDVTASAADPDILAELETAPHLHDAITALSASWREIMNDVNALTH